MIDFGIRKRDILLKKFYQEFDFIEHIFSKFYKHAIYVNERLLCYPEDQSIFCNEESFALIALKNDCIRENWNNIMADHKDAESIEKLFETYWNYHIRTEGLSSDIVDMFRELFAAATASHN